MSIIGEIFRDLLLFVGAVSVLLVLLILAISRMSEGNPLKRLLTATCYRVAATAAAGLVAIPIEPIPGIDVLYDVGVPIALVWYWLTLFRTKRVPAPPKREPARWTLFPHSRWR